MSTISQIRMWEDCGFTENCLEVPAESNVLPTPDLIISDDVNTPKDALFSRLRLRQPYSELMNVSYLEMTIDMNNGTDLKIYGWVDSVSVQSDTSDYPMTVIDWHIDYWRTYLSKAVFGSGMVRRRTADETIPPQDYPHRYVEQNGIQNITSSSIWWVVFGRVSTSEQITSYRWYCFPVTIGLPSSGLFIEGTTGAVQAPSLNDVIGGYFDERLGFDPETITYAFISPLSPNSYTGTGSSNSPILLTGWNRSSAPYFNAYGQNTFMPTTFSFSEAETTDTDIYMIMDMMGSVVGSLPWGFPVTQCQARIVADTTSAYIALVFSYGTTDVDASYSEGLCFNIMLPAVPVTSNAWSSYVYSGSRQAEMDMRQLQAESQAVSGGISTGTSAITGALGGALTGAVAGAAGGPFGMIAGALIGGAGSALGGAITTGLQYGYQSGEYADEMQRISDYKVSHQANSIALNGGGFDSCFNGIEGIKLVHMTWDSYSAQQRENDLELYGATVSEPTESCQSLIDAGGPLQISNLTVRGDIPVEAKRFFRTRFSKGVRIIGGST